MNFFKSFLSFFTVITTAITAVVGTVSLISGIGYYPVLLPLQILAAGALTALLTTIIYSTEFRSRKHFIIMTLIHYVLLCITMNIIGIMFGWTDGDIIEIVLMCIYVAFVYVITYTITYILTKKEADELNRALSERNRKS